jgi:pimeloyl-ACP methyl ester carboxylesterase
VCVHGSLCDFRVWSAVLGPLTRKHRVIAVSLRHFFPEHWDGVGDTYSIAQHTADVIAFIEKLGAGPVDLMGHSRGGHISFRVAQRRPELLRRLILAEPGGELDATLDPAFKPGPSPLAARIAAAAEIIARGDIDGGLEVYMDALEGPGSWKRIPAATKQELRDNVYTLLGQTRDNRPPFSKEDAEAIKTPTLFIGGANSKGALPLVLRTLAAHVKGSKTAMIPGTTHPMFEQAPQRFCEIVLEFLAT